MREQRPFGNWWKNHIIPQRGEKQANVVIFQDPLNWNNNNKQKNKNVCASDCVHACDRVPRIFYFCYFLALLIFHFGQPYLLLDFCFFWLKAQSPR